MLRRGNSDAAPETVFTDLELEFLDRSLPDAEPGATRNIDFYMTHVAPLGGYLARRNESPPGVIVMCRGFSRLSISSRAKPKEKALGQLLGN